MLMMAEQILILGGLFLLSLGVAAGLWVHMDSQRSATKTAGRYVMQLHLFCLLFGLLLLSLSRVVPLTAYPDSIKRLIASGATVGGACFATRTFILAVTRNPNVYETPNRLASAFGSVFAFLIGICIIAIFIGMIYALLSQAP